MADAFSSIKGLLDSGKYADLTIRCPGEVFKVHCAVVCTRCPFLAGAIDGQFKEAAMRDIDLVDDELPVVRAMIRYLYTDDYDEYAHGVPAQPAEPSDSLTLWPNQSAVVEVDAAFPLMFNVKMYIIGDKYDIPGLRKLAAKKYRSCVDESWNSAAFSASAQHLWTNTVDTDRQLRDIIAMAAHTNLEELMDRGEFVELMKSHGDFCFDVVKLQMGRSLDQTPEPEPEPEPEVEESGWRSSKSVKKKGKKTIW